MRRPHLTIMSEKNHAAGRFVRQTSALSHPAWCATFAGDEKFLASEKELVLHVLLFGLQ